jgi:hypothetical protein
VPGLTSNVTTAVAYPHAAPRLLITLESDTHIVAAPALGCTLAADEPCETLLPKIVTLVAPVAIVLAGTAELTKGDGKENIDVREHDKLVAVTDAK